MSLLTICQNAAIELQLTYPSTIFGNAGDTQRKLQRLATKVGKRLNQNFVWQGQRRERTFTGISGETQTAIIPADFGRFIAETFWNRTLPSLVSGPISPVEWASLKANDYGGYYRKFTRRGNDVLMTPALDGGESLAFEYVSTQWIDTDADDLGDAAAWTADTNTSAIDEELITLGLIFEYLDSEGLPSAQAAINFTKYFETISENDQPPVDILVSADIFGQYARHFDGVPASHRYGADFSW